MRKHKYILVYFAFGVSAAYEGDSFFGVLHRTILGDIPTYLVYGSGCFAAAVGALLFLALKKAKPTVKRVLVTAAFVLAALCPCVAGLAGTPSAFWASLALFYVAEGLNAAICAHYLHRLIGTEARAGTLLAVATVAGLVLNYIVDFLFPGPNIPNMVVLAAVIFAMMFLALRKIGLSKLLDYRDDPSGADGGEQRRRFLSMLIAVAVAIIIMSYMIGVNDMAIITTLLSGPESSIFIPQALLYLPALLIAGVLADVKKGKYFPIATLGCTLLTAPTVTRLGSPEVFTQYSGVTYFLGGFYLIYIMFCLVSLAWRSRRPALVTSLAAFLFFLFSGLGAFTSYLYIHADSAFSLTVYVGLVALLLVIFYLSGSLQPRAAEPAPEQPSVPDMPTLEELTASFGITPREMEVLRLLLSAKNTSDNAAEMVVTEKTVQNYIGSLLSKTGAKSRGEMIAKFRSVNP